MLFTSTETVGLLGTGDSFARLAIQLPVEGCVRRNLSPEGVLLGVVGPASPSSDRSLKHTAHDYNIIMNLNREKPGTDLKITHRSLKYSAQIVV